MLHRISLVLFYSILLVDPLDLSSQEIDASILEGLSPDDLIKAQMMLDEQEDLKEDSDLKEDETLKEINKDNKNDTESAKDSIENIEDRINLLNLKKAIQENELLTLEEKLYLIDEKDEETIKYKFGYEFFNKRPSSIDAKGDLPLPNDYKISIKDTFSVILSGSKRSIFDLTVKLDGTILFPELGSISVVGETLEGVKKKLTNLINQAYIGVIVDVSIKSLSAKKITIVGAVESPGTYLVNPFTTISSALVYSGGLSEEGSLRSIKLVKTDGTIHLFDLYDLLIDGDRTKDINIDAGDVILIEPARQFIELRGAVRRPAVYEVLKDESINDIIRFGLGLKETANSSKLSLSRLNLKNASIDQEQISDFDTKLKDVISVDVYEYKNNLNSGTFVSGAVRESGYYDTNDYPFLEDLLGDLDLIRAYPFLAILEQFDEENLLSTFVLFNLNDPSTYKSIKLTPNAKVFFLDILKPEQYIDLSIETLMSELDYLDINENTQSLIEDYLLTINHNNKSYKMPVFGFYSINSFVGILGLDMTGIDNNTATYINPVDNFISVGNYKNMNFTAKKFNNISFRSTVNTIINVNVEGEVAYPGNYSLNSNATISDLYDLVGGFKDSANLDGIILKRESVLKLQQEALVKAKLDLNESILLNVDAGLDPEVIAALSTDIDEDTLGRISGKYNPGESSNDSFILVNNDTIIVPKKTNTINVLGEVLNPNSFPFNGSLSIKEAIELAGGTKEFADDKKIYVIHASGLISKPSRNIFLTKTINLEAGDTIIVPREVSIRGQVVDNITSLTSVLSNLAFASAALKSLENNN